MSIFTFYVLSVVKKPNLVLKFDFFFQLINKLYTNGKFGFDVLSFDLQRGRDHGLPSYADYRKACGLREAYNFADFSDAMSNPVRFC